MPRNGGQRAAARQAHIESAHKRTGSGSGTGPRAVRPDNADQPSISVETGRSMFDLEFLRGLIEAVDGSGIDNFELNRAGTRIRISKTPPPAPVAAAPVIPAVQAAPTHAALPAPAAEAASATPAAPSTATAPAE